MCLFIWLVLYCILYNECIVLEDSAFSKLSDLRGLWEPHKFITHWSIVWVT